MIHVHVHVHACKQHLVDKPIHSVLSVEFYNKGYDFDDDCLETGEKRFSFEFTSLKELSSDKQTPSSLSLFCSQEAELEKLSNSQQLIIQAGPQTFREERLYNRCKRSNVFFNQLNIL